VDERQRGLFVARLAGELDIAAAAGLTQELAQIGDGTRFRVVVDLSELTFIDSSGLNALVNAARTVESKGGWIVFSNATQHVARVLEIVALDESVDIEPTLELALARAEAEGSPTS
jgi:anti-anti-sigma factor